MTAGASTEEHCPKNNLNFWTQKIKYVMRWVRCNRICLVSVPDILKCKQKPDKFRFRCICSSRDRLGFNAGIQIIFGTVYVTMLSAWIGRLYYSIHRYGTVYGGLKIESLWIKRKRQMSSFSMNLFEDFPTCFMFHSNKARVRIVLGPIWQLQRCFLLWTNLLKHLTNADIEPTA